MKREATPQTHLGRLLRDGVPAPTVAYAHTVLRTALMEAVRWGLVDRNVAAGAKSPRVVVREFPTWTAAEVARVFASSDTGDLAAFWRLALLCGLRRGELIGLWWEDVDLERGTLAVRRTMQKSKTGWTLGPPKTKKGKRSIALSRSCVVALKNHRDRQAFERQRLGDAWHESPFVFTNQTGGPLHVNTVIDRFERLIAAAGVPVIRFHDTRHTCATLLLTEGVHPKIVSELLGHSTVQQTLDVYSHVIHGLQRSVADVLDGAILAATEPVGVTLASPVG